MFEREQVFELPVRDVFDFFSNAANLSRITPPSLGFRFKSPPPALIEAGSEISYRIRVAGLPVWWTTLIREWDPPHRFSDLQSRGPYAYWLHTHSFSEITAGRTLMRDRVIYRVPFGRLGEVARRVFVEPQLRRIFDYREQAFGPAMRGEPAPSQHGPSGLRRGPGIAVAGVSAVFLGLVAGWRWARSRLNGFRDIATPGR